MEFKQNLDICIIDWFDFPLGTIHSNVVNKQTDMTPWLEENISLTDYVFWFSHAGHYRGGGCSYYVSFKNETDAMAFKLMWG